MGVLGQPACSIKSAAPGWAGCWRHVARELSAALCRASGRWPRCRAARGQRGELQGSFSRESGRSSPTRSHSAFCLFCCRRPRSGGFLLLDATRCRVWTCRARPLGSRCPCLPACSGARAARLRSPPVSGAGAGGLRRDLSLGAGRYRLTRVNSRQGRLGTAASPWTPRSCGSRPFAENTPEPRALGCIYLSA